MTLLDAYALIAFLIGGPAAAQVRSILREGDAGVTTANLVEVLDVIAIAHRLGHWRVVGRDLRTERHTAHVLNAAGDDQVVPAGHDALGSELDCLQAGAALAIPSSRERLCQIRSISASPVAPPRSGLDTTTGHPGQSPSPMRC